MDFKKAISVAEENARELVPNARNFNLEGVIISGDNYEVTISYYLSGQNPLELKGKMVIAILCISLPHSWGQEGNTKHS
ncbi:hypothetical protein ACFSQE_16930 [Vogesella fluminis]|uniref:hypothetical protein n=1 Tax=Vogesella fluminis TaxID=1069161 RepID=UPI0036444D6F